MIHKWEFEDSTTVRWTDKGSVLVDGRSPLAEAIREATSFPLAWVDVGIPPCGDVKLDLMNVWLMHKLCEQEARRMGVQLVDTTYTPSGEDIPPEAAKIIARDDTWAESTKDDGPETVY